MTIDALPIPRRAAAWSSAALCAAALLPAANVDAQQAYFSARGEITVIGGQHLFGFELDRAVTDAEDLRFATYGSTTGTINAAGDAIASVSYDGFLDLDRSGVGDVASNDDGGANVDALLSWPGVATGGALPAGSVPADTYLLRLSEFSDNEANPWAGDVIGPADAVRLRNLVPTNEPSLPAGMSRLDALKFGTRLAPGDAVLGTTPAVFDYGGVNTLTINGELSVAHTGYGTLNVPNGVITAAGPTTVGAAGVVNLTGGDLNANAGLTLVSSQFSPFPGAEVNVGAGSTLAVTGATTINRGATIDITGTGGFNANGGVTVDAGTLTSTGGGFALAGNQTLSAVNDGQIIFTGNTQIGGGKTFDLASGADLTVNAGQFNVGFFSDGTFTADGAGTTVTVNAGGNFHEIADGTATGVLTVRNQAVFNASGTNSLGIARSQTNPDTHGTLNVESGATATFNAIRIGELNGNEGTGTINVTGTNSRLTQNGASTLTLGNADTAGNGGVHTINVTNGGTIITGTGTTTIRKTGTLNVNTDGRFIALGDVNVQGGTITTDDLPFALGLSTNATVTATDNAQISFNGPRYSLGQARTFNIRSGSDFTTADGLDMANSSTGTLLVEGTGSTLDVNGGTVFVALNGGTAGLTVRDNATAVLDHTLLLGVLGDNNTGTLRVESGAALTAADVQVANDSFGPSNDTTGSITVTGTGSTFTQTGGTSLVVGGSGTNSTATLNIADGAVYITGTGTTTVHATGTVTVESGTSGGGVFHANGDLNIVGGEFEVDSGGFTLAAGKTLTVSAVPAPPSVPGAPLNGVAAPGELVVTDNATFTADGPVVLDGGHLFSRNSTLTVNAGLTNGGDITVGATFTIRGDYTQTADGELSMDIFNPILNEDLVIEDGDATLGGTLAIIYGTFTSNDLFAYDPLTIIDLTGSTPGTVGGVFGRVTVDDFDLPLGDFALAVTYAADAVLVQRALAGDANLSQLVEQGDLDAVLQNWGKTAVADGTSWVTGDLNQNGLVEQGDLDAVLTNWGDTANAPDLRGFNLAGAVPEPGTLAMLGGLAALAGLRRRAGR